MSLTGTNWAFTAIILITLFFVLIVIAIVVIMAFSSKRSCTGGTGCRGPCGVPGGIIAAASIWSASQLPNGDQPVTWLTTGSVLSPIQLFTIHSNTLDFSSDKTLVNGLYSVQLTLLVDPFGTDYGTVVADLIVNNGLPLLNPAGSPNVNHTLTAITPNGSTLSTLVQVQFNTLLQIHANDSFMVRLDTLLGTGNSTVVTNAYVQLAFLKLQNA